ncbi:LPS translocon maturation chaperone LptM [Parvularcula mediterranea]
MMKRLLALAALALVVSSCGKRAPLDVPPPPASLEEAL